MERYAAEQIAMGQEWGGGGESHHALLGDVPVSADFPLGPTSQRSQHLLTGPLWRQSHPRAEALKSRIVGRIPNSRLLQAFRVMLNLLRHPDIWTKEKLS